MRTISKGPEPASLAQHRCTPNADYDNYADKDALRASLVAEQRGLCCYCMSRIRPRAGAMKIAHWHSRNLHGNEQLDYANLLAACRGNDGQPRNLQHCDTHQADRDISRNPANPRHRVEELIQYHGNGTIASNDPVFDADLNQVLNLNLPFLRRNRTGALEGFTCFLRKRGELKRGTLERLLRDWNGESHQDELKPYCQVVVYWLRKRLARA
jgi:uncharacterized protein (TIGR02646 family)